MINRREFLGLTAGAGAALMVPTLARVTSSAAPEPSAGVILKEHLGVVCRLPARRMTTAQAEYALQREPGLATTATLWH
jgi:hypothetical protein